MAQVTFTHGGEKMETFKLLSGHSIPAVGIGTWKSGSRAEDSVCTAIVEVLFVYNLWILSFLILLQKGIFFRLS